MYINNLSTFIRHWSGWHWFWWKIGNVKGRFPLVFRKTVWSLQLNLDIFILSNNNNFTWWKILLEKFGAFLLTEKVFENLYARNLLQNLSLYNRNRKCNIIPMSILSSALYYNFTLFFFSFFFYVASWKKKKVIIIIIFYTNYNFIKLFIFPLITAI